MAASAASPAHAPPEDEAQLAMTDVPSAEPESPQAASSADVAGPPSPRTDVQLLVPQEVPPLPWEPHACDRLRGWCCRPMCLLSLIFAGCVALAWTNEGEHEEWLKNCHDEGDEDDPACFDWRKQRQAKDVWQGYSEQHASPAVLVMAGVLLGAAAVLAVGLLVPLLVARCRRWRAGRGNRGRASFLGTLRGAQGLPVARAPHRALPGAKPRSTFRLCWLPRWPGSASRSSRQPHFRVRRASRMVSRLGAPDSSRTSVFNGLPAFELPELAI